MSSKEKVTKSRDALRGRIIAEGYPNMSVAAEHAGLKACTLYKYTSGWAVPGKQSQKRLAKLLNISIRELRELL